MVILRLNTFFSINCRRKFHQAKIPASVVGFAREIQSYFIFHCYFNQMRISNIYFSSSWCCPEHSSLHKKNPTNPKPTKIIQGPLWLEQSWFSTICKGIIQIMDAAGFRSSFASGYIALSHSA